MGWQMITVFHLKKRVSFVSSLSGLKQARMSCFISSKVFINSASLFFHPLFFSYYKRDSTCFNVFQEMSSIVLIFFSIFLILSTSLCSLNLIQSLFLTSSSLNSCSCSACAILSRTLNICLIVLNVSQLWFVVVQMLATTTSIATRRAITANWKQGVCLTIQLTQCFLVLLPPAGTDIILLQ